MARSITFAETLKDTEDYPEFCGARGGKTTVKFSELGDHRARVEFIPPQPSTRQEKIFRLAVTKALEIYGDKTGEYVFGEIDNSVVLQFPTPTPDGRPRCETISEIIKPASISYYPTFEQLQGNQ